MAREVAAARVELEHDAGRGAHGGSSTARTSAALRRAADLREAAGGMGSGAAPGSATSTSARAERRLAAQRQPDDARGGQAINLAPGVRGAGGVGARDVEVDALGARLRVELRRPRAGRARARAARAARAPSSGPKSGQRGGTSRRRRASGGRA